MERSRCQISKLLAENPLVYEYSQNLKLAKRRSLWIRNRTPCQVEKRVYTVEEIASILNIGRTSAYLLVKEDHFKIVQIGNAIRISKKSFDEWLDSLEL